MGLFVKNFLQFWDLLYFASTCCKIITIIASHMAFGIPPVNIVIIIDTPTPIIAPKYGIIRFDKPIRNPSNIAYFTSNISIAIDVNIPTMNPSNNWLDKNLKNISVCII